MSQFKKAVCMGVFIGLLGVTLLPLTTGLEVSLGLDSLFRLRGPRAVPPAVAVVTLDRFSAEQLGVPTDPDEWPRRLHAQLIETLVRHGARVIAFDIIFDRPGPAKDDDIFARAIRRAGNVVLGQGLTKYTYSLDDSKGLPKGRLNIETLISPAPPLDRSALALAPFPLPKVPVQVSQYWKIKPEAGDVATLPVVAFQIWALEVWEDFVRLLRQAGFDPAAILPERKQTVIETGNLQNLIQTIRELFAKHRGQLPMLLSLVEASDENSRGSRRDRILHSLIRLYADGKSSYLDYYGPPGSVQTIRYSDLVVAGGGTAQASMIPDLEGRAVFVGLSERMRPDQKDGFNTVFSLPNGVDISGVEIAATAFANMAEDRPVRPFSSGLDFFFLCVWGVLVGFACFMLPPAVAAAGAIGLCAAYIWSAYHQFKVDAVWFPLVVPLLVQLPLAFFGSLFWQYMEASREKRNIRRAVGYYLPDHVVERLSRSTEEVQAEGRSVYGTCLLTDAEQYTRLSEQLTPEELSRFMNAYYSVIFGPVREQGGTVSDVVGDSMLALWSADNPDASLSDKACRAALQIARAVERFNRMSEFSKLPTRIGMHSGSLILGNIGAGDHFEYRPVGEVVNTASRIEGLNKFLNTRILVSKEVIEQVNGFFFRGLGNFLFVGKSNPVTIFELICLADEADVAQKGFVTLFSKALAAFQGRGWKHAAQLFEQVLQQRRKDGPSIFFKQLCERYAADPPGNGWDGSVVIDRK